MLLRRNALLFAAALSFVLVPFLAPVLGDGMAVYPSYIKDKDELEELYGSTYESRQLANVVLLDEDTQRIDLFLSLFSLKPGNNMTLLVPFREMPEEVKVKEMQDRDFLDSIGYSRIKEESERQDIGKSVGKLTKRTNDWLERGMTASSLTPIAGLGLYIADNYELTYSGEGKGWGTNTASDSLDEDGGDATKKKEVEKVSTYEFDGMSISVYSISENATMEDFAEGIEIDGLPEMTREAIEEYKGHYAVTIDSEMVPPIDPNEFAMMTELMPETMEEWRGFVRRNPSMNDEYDIYQMVVDLAYNGYKEIYGTGKDLISLSLQYGKPWRPFWDPAEWLQPYSWRDSYYPTGYQMATGSSPFDIMKDLSDLTHTVYGYTPFNGTVISVTTSLDDGDIYFPLGTSDSWTNPIASTVVVVKMDRSRSLDPNIEPDAMAFIEGDRYYLFDFPMDNPDDDLYGSLGSTKVSEYISTSAAEAIDATYGWVSIIIALLLYLLVWFALLKISYLAFGATNDGNKSRALSGRNLFHSLLALFITAPGVHLLFRKDLRDRDKRSEEAVLNRSHAAHSIAMLCLGAALFLVAVV